MPVLSVEYGDAAAPHSKTMTPLDSDALKSDGLDSVLLDEPEHGYLIGVLNAAGNSTSPHPHPGTSYLRLLAGAAQVSDQYGATVTVSEGMSLVVRPGAKLSWHTLNPVQVVVAHRQEQPSHSPELARLDQGVVLPDSLPIATMMTREPESIGGGVQYDASLFSDDAEDLVLGEWQTTGFASTMQPFSIHELAEVLEGEATIREASGETHHLTMGQIVLVTRGTDCSWTAPGNFRKRYLMLT